MTFYDVWDDAKAKAIPECEISENLTWIPFYYRDVGYEILLSCKHCHTPLEDQPPEGEAPSWWDNCCSEFELTTTLRKETARADAAEDLLFELHGL